MLQQSLEAKLRNKKVEKCKRLFGKNQSKKYKKFVLMKKYAEDYELKGKEDGNRFMQIQGLKGKFRKLRLVQREKDNLHG